MRQPLEALSYDGDSLIYAATANGVHKYNRNDNSWTYLDYAFARDVEVGPEGNVYAGLYNRPIGGLWMSTDRGDTWDLIGGEFDSVLNESIPNIETFSDGAIIASLYGRQYIYSENYGVTWDTIKHIGTAIGINDADELYIQKPNPNSSFGDLLKSTDRGNTVESVIQRVLYNTDRNSIATVGKDTVVVAVSVLNDTVRGIWRSFDGGQSWVHLYDSLTVVSIIMRPDGFIAGGTSYGLVYTTDQGKNWQLSSPDPDSVFTLYETEYLEDGSIFVGSKDHGVWQLEVLVSNDDRLNSLGPDDFSLSQNYPNPFNPSTMISYTLPAQTKVELKVYDILGREVRTLVNKELPAGRYEAEFNAQWLPSGVYIYRIKAGSFSASKKMLLVK